MSTSFLYLWFASTAGVATYYLLDNLYWELKSRYHTRQYNQFLDDLEEEYDLDFK